MMSLANGSEKKDRHRVCTTWAAARLRNWATARAPGRRRLDHLHRHLHDREHALAQSCCDTPETRPNGSAGGCDRRRQRRHPQMYEPAHRWCASLGRIGGCHLVWLRLTFGSLFVRRKREIFPLLGACPAAQRMAASQGARYETLSTHEGSVVLHRCVCPSARGGRRAAYDRAIDFESGSGGH